MDTLTTKKVTQKQLDNIRIKIYTFSANTRLERAIKYIAELVNQVEALEEKCYKLSRKVTFLTNIR